MRTEDSMRVQEEEEEEDDDDNVSRFICTRFCRSDPVDPATTGTYYPNYTIEYDANNQPSKFGRSRPTHGQDHKFEAIAGTLEAQILALSGAVGLLYVVKDVQQRVSASAYSAGTWSLYGVNNKRIGITTLHTAINGDDDTVPSRFFIDISVDRYKDKLGDVKDMHLADLLANTSFKEVFIHQAGLEARRTYINSLKPDTNQYQENLDPVHNLQSDPLLDVLVFDVPVETQTWPCLTLADAPPGDNTAVFFVAYHSTLGGRRGVDREYRSSVYKPPNPADVVHKHRSVGVGRVLASGAGIIDIISSTAFMSSGCGIMNTNLQVFAFSTGGFYDDPNPPKQVVATNLPWTKTDESSLIRFNMQLPEDKSANVLQSRNFNVALGVGHSGFKQVLASIAP